MKNNIYVFLILSSLLITSCTSLVYSPSINLPEKIHKDETSVIGAFERMPATNYSEENGAIVAIQHSFSDKLCIQFKYWAAFNVFKTNQDYLHGASLTAYYLLSDSNSAYKLFFSPNIGASLINNAFEFGAIGANLALQTPGLWILKPFGAIGLVYGKENFNREGYWGIGVLANLGADIKIFKKINAKIEFAFPTIYNKLDNEWTFYYLLPTIGFSYGL